MAEVGRAPTRTKAVLLLGVVFLLGAVCGGALFFLGQRSVGPPPPPGGPAPLDRLSRELDLTPEQQHAIVGILDEQRVQLDTVLEGFREAIREVLDPEQQRRFDSMRPPRPGGPGAHPPPRGRPPRGGQGRPPRGGPGDRRPGPPPPPPTQRP